MKSAQERPHRRRRRRREPQHRTGRARPQTIHVIDVRGAHQLGDVQPAGSGEAVAAGLAAEFAAAGVFVGGEGGVQAPGVVVTADRVESGAQHRWVGDLFELGPFGLDVPEEALDPGLVGGAPGRL